MQKKIICFDVDGVLIDSKDEVMLTSWNEYNAWLSEIGCPCQPFTTQLRDIPKEFHKTRTILAEKSHKGYYRVAINLFTLAGFNPERISIELIQEVSELDPQLKLQTMDRLNQLRERLIKESQLSTLIKTYEEVDYPWIEKKMHKGEIYFVTNNTYSIEGLKSVAFAPVDNQVRRPHGQHHNKAEHINEIIKINDISPEQLIFIDDSQASLEDVTQGTAVPIENIIQNSWCEKPRAQGFKQMSWLDIMAYYESA